MWHMHAYICLCIFYERVWNLIGRFGEYSFRYMYAFAALQLNLIAIVRVFVD